MFSAVDNIDSIIKATAELENKAVTEMLRENRKAIRRVFNNNKPYFKQHTPKRSGKASKSIKVRSRSRKGVTRMTMLWNVPYSNPMNFKRGTSSSKVVTSSFRNKRSKIESEIKRAVVTSQKDYLKSRGFRVK